jgi:Tfp pilus assembly protein PilE
MAALVAIALPQYAGFVERTRASEAITALGAIKVAEEANRLQTGSYTTVTADLGLTLNAVNWTYAVNPATAAAFTATATRTAANGGTAGQTITLTYTAAGVSTWGGNHPGAPA